MVTPAVRREAVAHLQTVHEMCDGGRAKVWNAAGCRYAINLCDLMTRLCESA
jgi:hypothetical protein